MRIITRACAASCVNLCSQVSLALLQLHKLAEKKAEADAAAAAGGSSSGVAPADAAAGEVQPDAEIELQDRYEEGSLAKWSSAQPGAPDAPGAPDEWDAVRADAAARRSTDQGSKQMSPFAGSALGGGFGAKYAAAAAPGAAGALTALNLRAAAAAEPAKDHAVVPIARSASGTQSPRSASQSAPSMSQRSASVWSAAVAKRQAAVMRRVKKLPADPGRLFWFGQATILLWVSVRRAPQPAPGANIKCRFAGWPLHPSGLDTSCQAHARA